MPLNLNNMTISGFRGATSKAEIQFDPSKSVTMVFGENGTGKSTIVDAFDFICNGRLGSLENYSLGGNAKKYVVSLGAKPSDIRVSLTCNGKTWNASLPKEKPVVIPEVGCPDAQILRRANILEIINAPPKDRYDSLKKFIAVPGIEKSENALRDAIKATDISYNEDVRSIRQAKDDLNKLWVAEGRIGKNAIGWAVAEVQKDLSQLQTSINEIDEIAVATRNAETALIPLDTAITIQKEAETVYYEVEANQKQAEKKQFQQNSKLVALLKDTKTYVTEKREGKCPICEQQVDPAGLLARLSERIDAMKELSSIVEATVVAKKQVDSKKSAANQAQKTFCDQIRALSFLLNKSSLIEVAQQKIDWANFKELLSHEEPSDAIEQQGRNLLSLILPVKQKLQNRKNSDQKSINQYNAIKGFVDTLKKKEENAKNSVELLCKLRKANEIVATQRKTYVEGILANISTEVEAQYIKLHPGENIGKVRFYLKPNTIGSLEFDAQFHNQVEMPPQAYFSESHLDTLGICVFIALAKYYKTESTIVVLDDVLTSVDNVHLDRLVKLLHEESSNFNHIIITTHYRPWREKYRYYQGPSAQVHFVELLNWTLAKGIRHTKTKLSVEEIQEYLGREPLDRQIVASKAGILLESLLDYLTILYQCRMPRKRDTNYALGDLLAGVGKNLRKSLKVVHVEPTSKTEEEKYLLDIINDLTGMVWLRNQVGCHWNIVGGSVCDQDIDIFVKRTLELANHLICEQSGELPYRENPSGHWESKGGHTRLYPLNNPD
jgi:hypothetical protein